MDRRRVRTTPASCPLHDPEKSILAHDNMVQPPRSASPFDSKEVQEVVITSAERETPSSTREGPTASMPQVSRMEQPGPTAYKLRLPDTYKGHNVFNLQHLSKYYRNEDIECPRLANPQDTQISSKEYEVEKIVGEQK